jgi:hypothetical protein
MRTAAAPGTSVPAHPSAPTNRAPRIRPVPTSPDVQLGSLPSPVATRIDLHQHLLTPEFLEALRSRTTFPRIVDEWTLLTEGESPYSINPSAHDLERRRMQELAEGKADVLVSLPGNLRIEDLPLDDARELVGIWHRSATALGAPFRVWASTPLVDFDVEGLEEALAHDAVVGLQLPAMSLGDADDLRRLRPVLAAVERSGKPVLVHPRHIVAAPVNGGPAVDTVPRSEQLKAAWSVWHEGGHDQHPTLRVGFIALAGLAPRVAAAAAATRPGKGVRSDPNVFYETSAYDRRAIDAMARIVGLGPLVHGSDRPFRQPRDPDLGRASNHAVFSVNPRMFLTGRSV